MTQSQQPAPKVDVDYNTGRSRLIMPEYGRCIQEMVEHALTLPTKEERQACANTIVAVMAGMRGQRGKANEVRQKLWNHLAAISQYKLDIDYPVEIERLDEQQQQRETIQYPTRRIAKRHYGYIIESLAKKLTEIDDEEARKALTQQVANQMKRSLARWNRDAMQNEKVLSDLAEYTEGLVDLSPNEIKLLSDNVVLSDVQQIAPSKKKKKK